MGEPEVHGEAEPGAPAEATPPDRELDSADRRAPQVSRPVHPASAGLHSQLKVMNLRNSR